MRIPALSWPCQDWAGNYWAFDGFAMILTQTKPPYASGAGSSMGYNNLYNALVIEVDLHYNSELGDISSNSLSLHRCYGIYCGPSENYLTTQRNLPIVNFLNYFFRIMIDALILRINLTSIMHLDN